MDSMRQHKFSRQILKDINEIFQKDPRHFFGQNLVTITEVEVAVDLSLAKIYFSVLPQNNAEDVLMSLNERKREIRGKFGNLIGKRIRIVPELAFFHDNTEEKANHMDKLIDSLDIPPTEEKTEED